MRRAHTQIFFHSIKKFAQIFCRDGIDAGFKKNYFACQIEPGSLETERFGSEVANVNR